MPEHHTPRETRTRAAGGFRRTRAAAALMVAASLLAGASAVAAPASPAAAAVVSVPVPAAKKTATPSVTIGLISGKSVTSGKKTTIKPKLIKKGTTQVRSAKLTVTAGKKTIAKDRSSATLGAGTYKVRTKLTYRVKSGTKWSRTKTSSKTQTLVIKSVKASAKINTAAGKKEVLDRINAKRKANKLKPLTWVKAAPASAKILYPVGVKFSGFYYFEKSQWPTARDWVELWFNDDPYMKRVAKDKNATMVTISDLIFVNPVTKKKLNTIDFMVHQGTDVDWSNARTRILNSIQKIRSDAKLPALIVTQGEPILKDGEQISTSSEVTQQRVWSDKNFREGPEIKTFARDRKFTHVSVSVVKKGELYDVSAKFYGVARA